MFRTDTSVHALVGPPIPTFTYTESEPLSLPRRAAYAMLKAAMLMDGSPFVDHPDEHKFLHRMFKLIWSGRHDKITIRDVGYWCAMCRAAPRFNIKNCGEDLQRSNDRYSAG